MNKTIEIEFFKQLSVSERTRKNYVASIRSTFLKEVLVDKCGTDYLFDITDLKQLWDLYLYVNTHPRNISNHRNYSVVISKYLRYLNNGVKYGKRIDYQTKRENFSRNKNKE